MPQRPDDDLTPGLQSPTEAAAQRAKPIFDRLVGEMRSNRAAAPGAPPPSGPEFGGGRRYDVALSLVAGLPIAAAAPAAAPPPRSVHRAAAPQSHPEDTALEPPAMFEAMPPPATPVSLPENEETTRVGTLDDEPTTAGPSEVTRTQIRRPPVGAPTVRPPARRPARGGPPSAEVLERTAESGQLRQEADGSMAFDIEFNDDMFSGLACTISVNNGRAAAVFRVSDDNTRRLLEGEAARLRAGLEDRGLKVEEVRVVLVSDY